MKAVRASPGRLAGTVMEPRALPTNTPSPEWNGPGFSLGDGQLLGKLQLHSFCSLSKIKW